MSKTIDEKVVEMRFDNKQFESNVATSMSTLEKLKKSLKLDGVSKGLEKINSAAKSNNLESLGNAANTVGLRFNAMYTIADQALRNITTRVQHTAESMVKALTIDPIMSGFKEYETQINAVQTIMANTSSKGTTLDQVNAALDELNKYADLTIYNFTEMTRNIGTFTAAGIDLDTSVSAIQGIANLAAVSGSTSQQASTAMYQLSQALASGTVKLMDWNSVVNAGMGGQVFQDALKETARVHGIAIDKMIEEQGSFRETLSEGWITSEILTETLEKFTMAAEEGSEQWEKYKQSLMDTGYTEAQAESILKMANTATDAATKVKTFTQLWDTLKEAAQSGWTQTWEYIIGDFEEAKAFLTELHGFFSGIIEESASRRNNLIGEVFSSNWEKLIGKINEAGVETSQFEDSIRKVVGDNDLDSLIEKYGSIQKAAEEGAISSNTLKKALDGIGSTEAGTKISDFVDGLKEIKRTLERGDVGEDVKKLQTALKELGYDIGENEIDGIIGPETEKAIKAFQEANGLTDNGMGIVGPKTLDALEKAGIKVEEINGNVNDLHDSCDSLVDVITKTNGRELLLESLMNVIKTIHRPLSAVNEALRDTFSISPDSLYNALEALNKFTSKFVMKGVLDATTWRDLLNGVKDLGIEIPDFERKLTEALKSNNVNVDSLIEKYGSLGAAFNDGAISIDAIKDVLLSFDGITESMLLGGESADKVRRAFEGLFAILDIISSVVGGGFKAAFNVLTAILDQFGMSVLDVAANMGDALVAFRDWIFEENLIARSFDWLISKIPVLINMFKAWFAVFKQTPAVQKLVDAIEAIQEAFNDLVNGDINISEFATSLGENLAKALKSLPDIALQIGKDFIAGFQNGISDSVSGVIDSIISFCQNFVSAFAEALGVASPSWKAYDIVVDFFKGAINAIKDMVGKIIPVLKKVGEKIVSVFKSFWDYITDESGNIEWGKIIAGGVIVSTLWVLKQLATAFKGIADALGGIQDLLANVGKVLKSFSKVLNSISWDIKAKALLKMAIAIAVLVAAIWVLTQIDDIGKLWNAVGVIVVLAGVLIGLSIAMSKLSSASVAFDAESKKVNIEGVQNSLLKIGIAILLVAAAVKMISGLKPEEAKQGFIGLAGIMGGMLVFLSAIGKLSGRKGIKYVDRIGKMMLKLSFAMMLMVTICKLIGKLSAEEMLKGAAFAAAFTIFVNSITKVAKSSGKNVGKVGTMVIGVIVAMTLMVHVCKLAGQLSAEEMLKGAAFATAFVFFVRELITTTKFVKKHQIAKLSGLLLSVSFSLVKLVSVCKLVGLLSVDDMIKGAAFMTGFVFLIKKLASILKIGESEQIAKVSAIILAMSVAIGILAGVSILLGIIDIASLAKGITAVTILSGMMALMIKSLKGAQNVKGAIMMMAVAIAIMAASVVALSFIDTKDLAASAGALALLMGVFALMIRSLKLISGATISLGPLLALGGIVLILTGIIAALSYVVTDAKKVLAGAGSIAGLMLVMVGVLAILGEMSIEAGPAMIGMLALATLGLVLRELVWVLASMSDVDSALSNVGALSALFVALVGMLGVMAVVGSLIIGSGGMALLTIITGLGTLALTALAIKGGVALFKSIAEDLTATMKELANASKEAKGIDVNAFDGVPDLLSIISQIGTTSLRTGIKDFFTLGGTTMDKFQRDGVAFFKAMGTIGEAASGIKIGSDAKDNIDTIIDYAEQLIGLQNSIPMPETLLDYFAKLSTNNLAVFGINAKSFIEAMNTAMLSIGQAGEGSPLYNSYKLNAIVDYAEKLVGLQNALPMPENLIQWFSRLTTNDLENFGEKASSFIETMNTAMMSLGAAGEGGALYNTYKLNAIIDYAERLIGLQNAMPMPEKLVQWFSRLTTNDLENFGEKVYAFIESMNTAMMSLGAAGEGSPLYNSYKLNAIADYAERLIGLQNAIPMPENLIQWFAKMSTNDIKVFSEHASSFLSAMNTSMLSIGQAGEGSALYNSYKLNAIADYAERLMGLQNAIPMPENLIQWFAKLTTNDIKVFGEHASSFLNAMNTSMSSIGQAGEGSPLYNSYKLNAIADYAERLIGLQNSIPDPQSLLQWFAKMTTNDIKVFGEHASGFIEAMDSAMSTLGESGSKYDSDKIDQMIPVAEKLLAFQNTIPDPVSFLEWWSNLTSSNIGVFGINASTFIKNLDMAMSALGENGGQYNTARLESILLFATKLNDLQQALPEDTLFDGKMDLKKFSKYIKKFAEAIGEFGSQAGEIDLGQMNLAIAAAYRIKYLINALADLDDSGVKTFAGGFASKGAAIKIAETMANFGKTVGEIDTGKMSIAVSFATRLKDLIDSLAGIDTSGIDKFKVDAIATKMKSYANKVAEIDTATVSSSITSANRLKTFVAGLAGLDSSGISNFKIGSIGQSLAAYNRNVSGFNGAKVNASIASANRLKDFISSLSGLDTSGIGVFKSAVGELSTVNVGTVIDAFSGASERMSAVGTSLITSLSKGMRSGSAAINSIAASIVSSMSSSIKSKSASLATAGKALASSVASGFTSNRSAVVNSAGSVASSGESAVRGYYRSFFQAGNYLVTGFARGIELSTWVAKQAAKKMAEDAMNEANTTLDVGSPSKEFIKIGGYVAEGFAIGISDLSYKSNNAAEGMATSAMNTTRTAMSKVLDAINTDMDAQPTIRPVVDLSDVQTGVNAINGLFNTTKSVGVQANLNAIGYSMNAMRQNGKNDDVISAINKLNDKLDGVGNTYNTINGVTYDDGSNVTDAIETLVRYAKIGGRV